MHYVNIISVDSRDAGKYTVRAINPGGEAQSIADFAIIEPVGEQNVSIVESCDSVTNQNVSISLRSKKNFII